MKLSQFEKQNLVSILCNHFQRFPLTQIKDVYKLLHQGCMGSEHAVKNIEQARKWLEEEIATLTPYPGDPLIDPISADKSIVRVNIRPFLQSNGKPEELLQWFTQTANEYQGSQYKLLSSWHVFEEMVHQGQYNFTLSQLSAFIHEMEFLHFPAIHHSELYESLYQPAYRVVARQLIPISWIDTMK